MQRLLQLGRISKEAEVTISFLTSLLGYTADFFLVEKFKRKHLLYAGLSLLSICLVMLYLDAHFGQSKGSNFLNLEGLIFLTLYSLIYDATIGVVPWILNLEIHPSGYRGFAGGICAMFNYATNYAVSFTLPIKEKTGSKNIYMVYFFINVVGILLVKFIVPETFAAEQSDLGTLPQRRRRRKKCVFCGFSISHSQRNSRNSNY